jgi:hypothetical protein
VFRKRELVLSVTSLGRDGNDYTTTPMFEFIGDSTAKLDALAVGQDVTVHFSLEGRMYNDRYYTTARGYKVEVIPTQHNNTVAAQSDPFGQSSVPQSNVGRMAANAMAQGGIFAGMEQVSDNEPLPF